LNISKKYWCSKDYELYDLQANGNQKTICSTMLKRNSNIHF